MLKSQLLQVPKPAVADWLFWKGSSSRDLETTISLTVRLRLSHALAQAKRMQTRTPNSVDRLAMLVATSAILILISPQLVRKNSKNCY